MKPYELTIEAARDLLDRKEISSEELTDAVFDRIEETDGRIGAYITPCREAAMARARQADQEIADGSASPLTGVPIAIKDNICTRGIQTTCASKILEGFVPTYNATVVEKLNAAGIVISFPQRDVHLDSEKPLRISIDQGPQPAT